MGTQIPQLNVDAPILPNEGLGGLALRTPLLELQQLVMHLEWFKDPRVASLLPPFEARYALANGSIAMSVDVRNGKVFKLMAASGYTGLLLGKVKVGMVASEAMRLLPQMHFSEREEAFVCDGVEGLLIEVGEGDPDPVEALAMTIETISVYVKEIETSAGNAGNW